jgi:DNA-binding NtrC family response regulator
MTDATLILVVDDDAGVREFLRRSIEIMGYRAADAGDAVSALRVLEASEVGLVLCDISMPGKDGVWLVDQILTRFPGVPVALATGLVEMDPRITLQPGVVGYITKPFTIEPLADLIKSAERWRRRHRKSDTD